MNKRTKTILWIVGIVLVALIGYRMYQKAQAKKNIPSDDSNSPNSSNLDYTKPLDLGSSGPEVEELQRMINKVMQMVNQTAITVDGQFGPQTASKLTDFELPVTLNQYIAEMYNPVMGTITAS
jgi:hypothetical protein